VYESCEALFCALADEIQKYSDWLALGEAADDLEGLVEQQLWGSADAEQGGGREHSSMGSAEADDKGVAAWELNVKALKTAAYDLGRLPGEVGALLSSPALAGAVDHGITC